MKLISILQSLREQSRPLSDEENIYLEHLTDEIRRATSDAARWRIMDREGLNQFDGFKFDTDVMGKLTEIRRAAMN